MRQTAVSRGQRGTTHEVFSCIRSCEREAQKTRKNAGMVNSTRESIAQWLHHRWRMTFTRRLLFSRRMIYLFGGRRRRSCWEEHYVPMMGSTLLVPKRCKNGQQNSGCSHICVNHSTTTKYGLWVQIPHHTSKSLVYVAETPTRGYLPTHSWTY